MMLLTLGAKALPHTHSDIYNILNTLDIVKTFISSFFLAKKLLGGGDGGRERGEVKKKGEW